MGSALIIVWRESVEAILVVGILYAWLKANDARAGMRSLMWGVAGGVGVAFAFGAVMLAIQSQLAVQTVEWMQTAIVFVAAVLIVQMVLWMREHGRRLKGELESGAADALRTGNLARIAVLAAVAVGREGAETVLFLYGLMVESSGAQLAQVAAGAALGLALALATFWLLSNGVRWMSWRLFFRVSEALLLLFASALLVGGVDRLTAADVLAAGAGPQWDTTWLLDDTRGVGNVVSQFAGYRARPDVAELTAWALYWLVVFAWIWRGRILGLFARGATSRG